MSVHYRKPRVAAITDGMLAILKNIEAGRPAHEGIWTTGTKHTGGLQAALRGLVRRGLISPTHLITNAGRAVLTARANAGSAS